MNMSSLAGSEWIRARYSPNITGMDRSTVRAQTVLSLTQPYNARCAVKYQFFARILALRRALKSTSPTIYPSSAHLKLDVA
jgi:hypothetical protein